MAWPPRLTKISVDMISRNCAITGTLPTLGSIRLAIDRPMELEMVCPATTTAAVTICKTRPMKAPIIS